MKVGRVFHKKRSLNPSLKDKQMFKTKHLVDMLTDLERVTRKR